MSLTAQDWLDMPLSNPWWPYVSDEMAADIVCELIADMMLADERGHDPE